MEYISKKEIKIFENNGFDSEQLIFPENSNSERITITRVTVQPGAINDRHKHDMSEQIWIALKGNGILLLDNDKEIKFSEGDIVRFEDGEIHGFHNDSNESFVYISITSPPINFRKAYIKEKLDC